MLKLVLLTQFAYVLFFNIHVVRNGSHAKDDISFLVYEVTQQTYFTELLKRFRRKEFAKSYTHRSQQMGF